MIGFPLNFDAAGNRQPQLISEVFLRRASEGAVH